MADETDSVFDTERIGAPHAMRSHSSQDAAGFQTVCRRDGELAWTYNDVFVDEIVRLGPGGWGRADESRCDPSSCPEWRLVSKYVERHKKLLYARKLFKKRVTRYLVTNSEILESETRTTFARTAVAHL